MNKILIISRGIPTKKEPMWGNFELDQAVALRDQGNQVVCMSIDRRIRLYWRKIGITKEVRNGIPMYNYFFPLPYRILPRFVNNFFINIFLKRLYKHIVNREGKFNLIHGHYLPNIRIAAKIKDLDGTPAVGTEHWSELKRSKIKSSVYKDAQEAYPVVDQLIAVSLPLQKIILDNFGVKSKFVGCVIDDVFGFVPKYDDGVFRFIAVGSLFTIKGFDYAIKAFAEAGFNQNVQFHIIGSGSQYGYLNKLISHYNLENQVFLEGRKTRKEIMEFLSKSSAFVLSSISENFATACMEALSAGLPAIMTKCGGPEDFVDASNSLLVPVKDVSAMAIAMRQMVNTIDKYNRKEISDSIKSKYSASVIASELDNIYTQIQN